MSHTPNDVGATAADRHLVRGDDRVPPTNHDVRPAERLTGAHDTYEKGELSSVGPLLGDIANDISTLMRQEVALAKLEVAESAKTAGKGAGMLAGAGVAGHFVLLFVSIALWWGLGYLVGGVFSAIIVAALWAVVAAVLASMGRKELKNVNGAPRTVETAKQVPGALKGNENRS